MRITRKLAPVVAGAALVLLGPAAMADTVYNDLDNTIDSPLETLALNYDSVAMAGTSGTTTLAIQVDGHPGDHPGCNIQGGAEFITLAAATSTPGVATVDLSNGGTFDACTDTVTATVQAIGLGSTDVTFSIVESKLSNDPHLMFSLDQAAFTVNVTEGPVTNPMGCDADPAAPAWANAILAKANLKPKIGGVNYVSIIAQEMGQGATFGGFVKNAHPQYENAVHDRLQVLTGRTLPSAQSAARPGWECAPE
jgi:hypothetical protein